jgi:hypothetical protein
MPWPSHWSRWDSTSRQGTRSPCTRMKCWALRLSPSGTRGVNGRCVVTQGQGAVVASLYDRLDQEEAALHSQKSLLHEPLRLTDERLQHVAITREMLKSLGVDHDAASTDGPLEAEPFFGSGDPDDHRVPPPSPAPGPTPSSGPLDWDEGRRRILSLLATAGQPMKAREVASAIGEDVSTPARVETTRGRLKRLVKDGHTVEGPVGFFSITSSRDTGGEGEAPPTEA